ncbi:MAG: hypothetical protein ACR2O6_13555, partial [Ilumatobacteraceae bacterium]
LGAEATPRRVRGASIASCKCGDSIAKRHQAPRRGAYAPTIDEHDDDTLQIPVPDDETDEDIRPDSFVARSGFLRSGSGPRELPRAESGPVWTFDEADEHAREFLAAVADGRELEHDDDPIELARANGLMILFGPDENDAFATLLARMPPARAEAWRDLMAGGASSEAFGPLTLQERLDEKQVDEALQSGRKQRLVNVAIAVGVIVVVAGLGVVAWNLVSSDDDRTSGALQFDAVTEEDPVLAAIEGGPPVAEPLLTESLSTTVAVAEGAGDVDSRITDAPFTDHRFLPGELRASVFQYAASGQVVVVGTEGFVDLVCLRASVVTSDLRPLDTVWFGNCADPVGDPATIGCLGPTAVLLALEVPPGEVVLPEGGTGFADAVRIQSITDDRPEYESLSVRATIAVPTESDVVIPRFGGTEGDELVFDLGSERVGSCTLTGNVGQ